MYLSNQTYKYKNRPTNHVIDDTQGFLTQPTGRGLETVKSESGRLVALTYKVPNSTGTVLSVAEGTGLSLLEDCCWIQQTDNGLKTVRSVSGRLSTDRQWPEKSKFCIRTVSIFKGCDLSRNGADAPEGTGLGLLLNSTDRQWPEYSNVCIRTVVKGRGCHCSTDRQWPENSKVCIRTVSISKGSELSRNGADAPEGTGGGHVCSSCACADRVTFDHAHQETTRQTVSGARDRYYTPFREGGRGEVEPHHTGIW